jgi:hypothetical protein
MPSKRARLAVSLLALLPHAALAQNMEAEWRVVNTASPTAVPDYAQQPNPFPITPEVEVVVQPVVEEVDETERTKAEALANARALITSNAVFRPRLEGIVFDGYMKGAQGEKVFAQGRWHGVGSGFRVPVRGADQAYRTIDNLREIDAALADEVAAELNARLSTSSQLELKITKLSNKEVTLSGQGETFTVPVRQSGF